MNWFNEVTDLMEGLLDARPMPDYKAPTAYSSPNYQAEALAGSVEEALAVEDAASQIAEVASPYQVLVAQEEKERALALQSRRRGGS